MRIFFVRHGESQANILHEISNRGLKHPLTGAGREQALALAEKVRPRTITRIYSSPLLRAVETAAIIANSLGVEYEVSDGLREYDTGILEGRADEEAWRLWQNLFDGWAKYGRWDQRIEGGESFYEVKNRFVPFIDTLVERYKSDEAGLLCVGHYGVYEMMLPLVLRNVDAAFLRKQRGFPYAGTVVAELTRDGLVCTDWNGTNVGA